MQFLLGDPAARPQFAYGEAVQKPFLVSTPDDLDAIGFGQTGRDLGDLFARTGPDGGDQAGLVEYPSAQLRTERFDLGLGCADQFWRLAERLVEGELLDDGHHSAHGVE